MESLSALLGTFAGLFLIAFGIFWVGLQTLPNPFSPPPKDRRQRPQGPGYFPLPDSLPPAVRRHFEAIFPQPEEDELDLDDLDEEGFSKLPPGAIVPNLENVELRGRGRIRIGPILLPVRFRSEIRLGVRSRRSLEVTWFRTPLLRVVDEIHLGPRLSAAPPTLHGPNNELDANPSTDSGADSGTGAESSLRGRRKVSGWLKRDVQSEVTDRALGLAGWAELLAWVPAAVAVPPARWRSVDPALLATFLRGSAAEQEEAGMDAAVLEVPVGERSEIFLVHFDHTTGLAHRVRTLKPKGKAGELAPWRLDLQDWKTLRGIQIPSLIYARWEDEPGPYAALHLTGRTDHSVAASLEAS
ncbi:MAG: DUF6544 family protein [Acidobacteriota bacterium]